MRLLCGIALATVMLVTVPAASALADARVRLVNAVGGADPLRLEVSGTPAGGVTEFGSAGDYAAVPAGEAELVLVGGPDDVRASESLEDGSRYTVVAFRDGSGDVVLRALRSGRPAAGEARLRVFHAAPELGSPDIRIGERTVVERIDFRSATRYLTLSPGNYTLAATRPRGGDAIFSTEVSPAAGTSSTVILAGSGGAEAQAIVVEDAVVTPARAPETGLGGAAVATAMPAWALALLAAIVAGSLGGALQLRRTRRTRP